MKYVENLSHKFLNYDNSSEKSVALTFTRLCGNTTGDTEIFN